MKSFILLALSMAALPSYSQTLERRMGDAEHVITYWPGLDGGGSNITENTRAAYKNVPAFRDVVEAYWDIVETEGFQTEVSKLIADARRLLPDGQNIDSVEFSLEYMANTCINGCDSIFSHYPLDYYIYLTTKEGFRIAYIQFDRVGQVRSSAGATHPIVQSALRIRDYLLMEASTGKYSVLP